MNTRNHFKRYRRLGIQIARLNGWLGNPSKEFNMDGPSLFDNTYKLLSKSLNINARRHSLITGNIANMDTVGYRPMDLDFNDTLKKAMAATKDGDLVRTHPDHLQGQSVGVGMSGNVRRDATNRYNLDSVNIDTEMTNLMENNLKYRTNVEILLRKIGMLRQAITEGGR
jgi:flagellar basal-body rod protein FlgB